MEPDRQIEVQLGHMCNNRCVFCVSGQRTAMGEALPMPVEPILTEIRAARAAGHRKITLLGGEPTLQPGFMEIVRETVALGFAEIVLFTNGAKTARPAFIDAIRALGGPFTWRISIQGASEASHERTTRKDGSFARIVRTLENLAERGERITVNACIVQTNFSDLDLFPALLAKYGVSQLHLDMVRPLDAGIRTEEELRAMIPRYSDLAPPMRRMVAGFPPTFDANIGNLPYCIAPDLAPVIHHDGEPTQTIAIDGDDRLSRPWDKYLVKRRDKLKPARCNDCVFDPRCSGVFETYARFYGLDELVPIDADALRAIDVGGRLLALWVPPLLPSDVTYRILGDAELDLTLGSASVALRSTTARDGAHAAYERFTVHRARGVVAAIAPVLASLSKPVHPLGDDASQPSAPAIAAALRRLRTGAPFAPLAWRSLSLAEDGTRAELVLDGEGASATVWIALSKNGRPSGGYRVQGEPSEDIVRGLKSVLAALA